MIKKRLQLLFILTLLSTFTVSVLSAKPKAHKKGKEKVKNVILMIGDGMGFTHISSAMYWQEEPMQMLRSEYGGAITTHSANNRVTDSAASGTALACGQKTNNGMLGMTPDSVELNSILKMAKDAGLATGLVTSTTVTHATPAAFYSNVGHRSQEAIIAEQLLEEEVDIIIGVKSNPFKGESNLIDDFKSKGYSVVFDTESTYAVEDGRLLALLAIGPKIKRKDILPEATLYSADRLSEMSKKGFFLMVEAAQIDHRAHDNDGEATIEEVAEFDRAVGEAFTFADNNPGTLVVIVADHETGGFALPSNDADFTQAESGIELKFSSGHHTATMVPMLAYGVGAERFSGIKDNTEIPKIIAELLGVKWK